jgi:transposase
MNYLNIENAPALASAIETQIDSTEESRLFKKLYTILLVAKHPNNNCSEVARLLGISPHTVARWVARVCTKKGFDLTRLNEKAIPGRPRRLNAAQLDIIKDVIGQSPKEKGFQSTKWSGKILSDFIKKEFYIDIQERQCQKILVKLSAEKEITGSL